MRGCETSEGQWGRLEFLFRQCGGEIPQILREPILKNGSRVYRDRCAPQLQPRHSSLNKTLLEGITCCYFKWRTPENVW